MLKIRTHFKLSPLGPGWSISIGSSSNFGRFSFGVINSISELLSESERMTTVFARFGLLIETLVETELAGRKAFEGIGGLRAETDSSSSLSELTRFITCRLSSISSLER